MKLARIQVDGDAVLARVIDGELEPVEIGSSAQSKHWLQWRSDDVAQAPAAGPRSPLDQAHFLPAVDTPGKIIAVGLNYYDHAVESSAEPPAAPLLFSKTDNTVAAHGSTIRCPSDLTTQSDFEAELAVVIGRPAARVAEEDALDYVFAYTIANDVSARDAQFADGQWMRGKSFDTYCPIGPFLTLVDAIPNVMDLRITARLNGAIMQDDRTSSMIFGVPYLISYISRFLSLAPGDVILTGTPSGVGFAREPAVFLRDADHIEVEIELLGTLSNVVSAVPAFQESGDVAVETAGSGDASGARP